MPESGFEVTRRVVVDFEGISLRKKFVNGLEPDNIHMMIGMYVFALCLLLITNKQSALHQSEMSLLFWSGSMTIDCLGMLTELSDCERKLFPVGYQ